MEPGLPVRKPGPGFVRLHRIVTQIMLVFALVELALAILLTLRNGSAPLELFLLVLLSAAIAFAGLRQQRKWKS
jgi:hypothetical protein